jgi:N-acetylglucosaminyl-diphospho-decaprenol L-rhamnosyltransferase
VSQNQPNPFNFDVRMSFPGAIVIVNFNSGRSLEECLDSIVEHASGARVLVVDNASSDGSEAAAERAGTGTTNVHVALQRNRENVGFAKAVNQGLARTSGELLLLLNPDCRLLAGAVEMLRTELAAHPECAIVAPVVLDDDGTAQGNVRGDPNILTGLFGRSALLRRMFPGSGVARRNVRTEDEASGEADWVSGACMMVRRTALEAVGGFDERYFLYWEDADVCRRLRVRGHTIRYVRDARVVHRTGQSSRSAPALATQAFHQSAYVYYATHVARTRVMRALAWGLLRARCRWKLRVVGNRSDSP